MANEKQAHAQATDPITAAYQLREFWETVFPGLRLWRYMMTGA